MITKLEHKASGPILFLSMYVGDLFWDTQQCIRQSLPRARTRDLGIDVTAGKNNVITDL